MRVQWIVFFFNPSAPAEISTLSLHDALPILAGEGDVPGRRARRAQVQLARVERAQEGLGGRIGRDRKSTRLNSSHRCISYAVFCLKKKKKQQSPITRERGDADRYRRRHRVAG